MPDEATAFVPGHVTGFFTVDEDDDPTVAGSRGCGLALDQGVTVTVRPAEETTVFIDDVDVELDAVERVLGALEATAVVRGETDLPLGAGFGVSGAMALGTALAANAVFDRRLSANELVTVAHGAEVQAGTGLGDVVGQARGGVPIRLEPGGPHHNEVDDVPARSRVEYHVVDDLDTESVLSGDTTQLTAAGERSLSRIVQEPTLSRFVQTSRRFAREADLLTSDVRAVIEDVAAADGEAAMAMLGETVFALGTGLRDAGYDATVTSVDPGGARLLD